MGNRDRVLAKIRTAKKTGAISLYLSNNQLTEIPPEIANLTQLQSLYLSSNQLTEIPPEIANLTQLQSLSLSSNQLTEIPPEIANLTQLQSLNLSHNQLAQIPREIAELSSLENLDLENNLLQEIPSEISQLSQLQRLDLSYNLLTRLPQSLSRLRLLNELYLHKNERLWIPAEVLGPTYTEKSNDTPPARPKDILDYYYRSLQEPSDPLLEAKILIVGQGAVGKTSLVQRLVHNTFDPDEAKTEGIDIVRWRVLGREGETEDIRVNVWDFGGQEIMHATHQFFLTHRSLYLLVLDARKGENESNLQYWLRIVQTFGGQAPVLVVINKSEAPNELQLNEPRLQKDYAPNVRGFFATSCQDGTGIEALRAQITQEIHQLEPVYNLVPKSFLATKKALEEQTRSSDYIELQDYETLCVAEGIEKASDQALLLRFLHDLGSVLHFSDPDSPFQLEQTKILNPEWVTRGVYRVLNNNSLMQQGGVLHRSTLAEILPATDGYDETERLFILGMMRKFELCFEFTDGTGRYLVPELLSPREPELGYDEQDALRFEYHYRVLPEGLIPRFIVRGHDHLTEKPTYWRSGVVLGIEDHPAVVRGDTLSGRVHIAVYGPKSGRRRALAVVRSIFRGIHRTVGKGDVQERVSLPGFPGESVRYEYLLRLEAGRDETFLSESVGQRFSVQELLESLATPAERQEDLQVIIGDQYNFQGQVGAAGREAVAANNTFQHREGPTLREVLQVGTRWIRGLFNR